MHRQPDPQALVLSYRRFSNPSQAAGDSIRRQTSDAQAWCARYGLQLDTSRHMEDRGVSAFRGKHRSNPELYALASFLERVQDGDIPPGSFLIIENLDRLSREKERYGLRLMMDILDAGVNIVQLEPETIFWHDSFEMVDIMRAVIELSRGHSESNIKSKRLRDRWGEDRRQAVANKKPMIGRSPPWLRRGPSGWDVIEEIATIVRQIYLWAAAGYGARQITRRLAERNIPPIGGTRKSTTWWVGYVSKLLRWRAVIGDFQPDPGSAPDKRREADVIPGYYPPIITSEQFYIVQGLLNGRIKERGRLPKGDVNFLAGLVYDALSGLKLYRMQRPGEQAPILRTNQYRLGSSRYGSVPLLAVEKAVLHCLKGIRPEELYPGQDNPAAKLAALAIRREEAETSLARIEQQMVDNPDLEALVRTYRVVKQRYEDIKRQIQEAKLAGVAPQAAVIGQCHDLACYLDNAKDRQEALIKLRAVLRRAVAGIYVVQIGDHIRKKIVVQMHLRGLGQPLSTLVDYRSATAGYRRPRTGPSAEPTCLGTDHPLAAFDLRDPAQAHDLETQLLASL
jgi:DNA invertase Pin-like site-specific DNA recombinase